MFLFPPFKASRSECNFNRFGSEKADSNRDSQQDSQASDLQINTDLEIEHFSTQSNNVLKLSQLSNSTTGMPFLKNKHKKEIEIQTKVLKLLNKVDG